MADTNIEVKCDDVRLSFFNGFKPKEGKDDDGNVVRMLYDGNLLIPKESSLAKRIRDAMGEAKTKQWGDSPPRLKPDQLCLRDGEPVDPDTCEQDANGDPILTTGKRVPLYDGYAGNFYLTCNKPVSVDDYALIKTGQKPRPVKIIGPRKGPDGKFAILTEASEFAPYSGCFVNAVVRIYAYPGDPAKQRPPRINASLEAVQFKRHGEAFGARGVDVDNAFDEEEGEDQMVSSTPAGAAAADGFDIG